MFKLILEVNDRTECIHIWVKNVKEMIIQRLIEDYSPHAAACTFSLLINIENEKQTSI